MKWLWLGPMVAWGGEIHEAARRCGRAELERALAAGAAVEARDAAGNTPLHVAVQAGQMECVVVLRGRGANAELRNGEGKTAWQLAAGLADRAMAVRLQAVLLALPAGREMGSPFVREPLQEAARRGDADYVAMLLQLGADPNGKGADGATALQAAALKGHGAVVELLLRKGARVSEGWPLHDAAVGGSAAAVRAIVRGGVPVNAVNPGTGDTALHAAAAWGRVETARALLELGADRTVKNGRGRMAFAEAEANGFGAVAGVLRGEGR